MATFLGITSGRNWSTEMPVGGETGCACKGVRFCAACKDSERVSKLVKNGLDYYIDYKKYVYAAAHGVAVLDHLLPQYPDLDNVLSAAKRVNEGIASNDVIAVPGLHVVLDFLALNEEVKLVEEIDRKEWVMSQSGRRKQDYGPQVNFKRKKIKMDRFVGMPHYVDYLLKKMSLIKRDVFGDYHPYELCNLEYDSSRMSAIEMHHDDCWIWGNRLICLNLLGEAVLTFVNEDKRLLVYVPLPRRTLVCMTGEIRYSWKHGVLPEHIRNRRIALTMRESSDAFKEGGDLYEKYGRELTRLGKIRV